MKIPDAICYKILKKYKINIVKTLFAKNMKQAEIIAENMKFPIVLKIDSPDIVHKHEYGCVRFVYSMDELDDAFEGVMSNARKITERINGIIIQEAVTESLAELIIGGKYDKNFKAVIMFGSGGIYAEKIKDIGFRLVPIMKRNALGLINDTKISRMFNKEQKEMIADAILKISKLIQKEKIREIDVNPLFLTRNNVVAGDVRIII